MCDASDAVAAGVGFMVGGPAGAAVALGGKQVMGSMMKKPQQPDVVREDPAAQQAKLESDAAQDAQFKTLEQRRRARANSLLSRAGGAGDQSPADVLTPMVTGKPNLGA